MRRHAAGSAPQWLTDELTVKESERAICHTQRDFDGRREGRDEDACRHGMPSSFRMRLLLEGGLGIMHITCNNASMIGESDIGKNSHGISPRVSSDLQPLC